MKWLFLVLGIAAGTSASVLLKLAVTLLREFPSFTDPLAAVGNWPFWLGLLLYGAAFLLYAASLMSLPLNVVHPTLTGGTISTLALVSILVFREQFYWTTGTGIVLVIVGALFLTARV